MKRREFIKTTTAAGVGAFVLPRFSIGKPGPSPNSKMNIAMIGAGGIAGMAFDGCQDENIVALCDIDKRRRPSRKKYPQTDGLPFYQDFRVMLDEMGKDIDGVVVSTPDHTHFGATLAAMERGMHVCTQKPLTHNVWEARTLQRAKAKYKVVTNMANQGHTYDGIREMREMYEAGLFGQVSEVHMGFDGPNFDSRYFARPQSMPLAAEPIPKDVDWDLWTGPARKTVYNSMLHPAQWRSFWDYGTGMLGDWFCHIGDGPVWVLDLYAPTVVECVESKSSLPGVIPDHSIVRYDFPARGNKAACSMYWHDGLRNGGKPMLKPDDWSWGATAPAQGSMWIGSGANAYLDQRSNNPRFAEKERTRAFKESGGVAQTYERVKGGPFREWIRAVKGDGPEPGSNFDYAAPLSEVCLLGALAQRFGGRIEWDAENMRVTNRPELNAYIREPARAGWAMGDDLWS
jgi:predicted dehydrogenase